MPGHHLAQMNIGRLHAPVDDPMIADFVAQLDEINALAEASPGFVWRLQTEDGNATAVRAYDDELISATKQYFKLDSEPTTVDSVAEYYRHRNTAAVVFTIDSQTVSGHRPNSVENLIEGAVRNNDVLIPFGTVDPLTGDRAVIGVHRQLELGVKGFKFHPSLQGFEPNDRAYYPMYSAIALLTYKISSVMEKIVQTL